MSNQTDKKLKALDKETTEENRSQSLNILFGLKIRGIRESLNLSQEQFADKVDMHRTYIGQIERAEKNITLASVEKIANALGIDVKKMLDPFDIE